MHEFSIARELVELASAEARRVGAVRITRVRCRVGPLRQLDADLLAQAFDILREGTPCAQADLSVASAPLRGSCPTCGIQSDLTDWHADCPRCGGPLALTDAGDELELTAIDVETPA